MMFKAALIFVLAGTLHAQEAESGFELHSTVAAGPIYSHELTESPRDGEPVTAGFQALFYPTWKLNSHWAVSGAIQVHSRPYFSEEFDSQGYGIRTNILNANLSYSQFWGKNSLVIRAGQLTPAFGAFLLRYDPALNPFNTVPSGYGYYNGGVAVAGLAGAQADATLGRFDMRAQFTNSSPLNPRSVFDRDQYGTWTAGAGYTIRQGFRVGISAFHGPYLDRRFKFYFRGEAPPRELPATGLGLDVQWGLGPWNVFGEAAQFQMTYQRIPTVHLKTGYAEARRVLHPRWFAAVRAGYTHPDPYPGSEAYDVAAGFRPSAFQILKFSYSVERYSSGAPVDRIAMVQFVTTFKVFGLAGN